MRRRHIFIFLLALCALLSALWIYSSIRHAFDDDEFQHLHISWLLYHGYTPYTDFFEHHLVFYHRLMAPLFSFGEGFWQIFLFRGISLLSAAGALFLLYRCGRSFGLSPAACGIGVWLLGLAPMFLLKMTEARPEPVAIFAFAGALNLIFAKSAESPEILSKRIRWKFIFTGILLGAMTLLSQKYVISAGTLLAAIYFLHGWKPAVLVASAFCAALAAYCCWMLAIGAGNDAFESVILMNLRWKYSFSSSGYFVELYTSAGILLVTGVFGILRALFQGRTRRQAFALATLLAGCVLQILLVPVPYRQAFLPLLAILALGTMFFSSYILQLDADHSDFNHVGGGTLDRRVDGVALGGGADGAVGGVDVADVAAASGDGFDVAFIPRGFDNAVHAGFNRRILFEIALDNFRSFFARNAQTLGEAEGGDAIDDAEVDHLGFAAHVGRNIGQRDAEDARGGGGVNVFAAFEGGFHVLVAAEVRHDAQFDL